MNKGFLVILLFVYPIVVSAQSVAWNCMCLSFAYSTPTLTSYNLGVEDSLLNSSGFEAYMILDVSCADTGLNFRIETRDLENTLSGFIGNWLVADAGDVASEATTRHQGNYLNHAKIDGETGYTTYNLDGTAPQDYYLIFCVENLDDYNSHAPDPRYAYGWAHLAVNDDASLTLLGSAMSLDGTSLVVGAIPEPSAGVLLILGLVGLALRRPQPAANNLMEHDGHPDKTLPRRHEQSAAGRVEWACRGF